MSSHTSLTELANRYGTDKGTQTKEAHGYSLVYDLLFSGFRLGEFNLLEIGLAIGGPELGGDPGREVVRSPSVEMWIEHFPHARIYGADISDFSKLDYDRFTFTQVDCSKPEDVRRILGLGVKFDIIIDDASHASYHQQVTLANLFPALKPGGLFIIEDLHWQPGEYERSLPQVPKTADWLATLLKAGELTPTAGVTADQARLLSREIQSLSLYTKAELDEGAHQFNRSHALPPRPSHQLSWSDLPGDAAKRGLKKSIRDRLRKRQVKLAVMQRI
ncbi:MAG: hypothetical protein RH982_16720 [Parvibaculum sp.]